MSQSTSLKFQPDGDLRILVTRHFAAKPEALYRAHLEPDLVRQWMFGPPGWRMTECTRDARPGGDFRFAWAHDNGATFAITGTFIELVPFSRIVRVERMPLPDTVVDNRIETRFDRDTGGTALTLRMTLPSAKARDALIATGMKQGMAASYDRLDQLTEPQAKGHHHGRL